MDKNQFSAKWHEFKGKLKEKWGKLTDHEIEQINGKMDQLSEQLQKKYGWIKEKADKEISAWCASCEHKGQHGMNYGPHNMNEGQRNEAHDRGMNQQNRGQHNMNEGKKDAGKPIHEGEFSRNKEKPHNDKYDPKEKKRKAG